MRLSQAEKMEIIRIVEGSQLSLRQTLQELGVWAAAPSLAGISATWRAAMTVWFRQGAPRSDSGTGFRTRYASRWWRLPLRGRTLAQRAGLPDHG